MLALANAIFELLYPDLKTRAVFTIPARALVNACARATSKTPSIANYASQAAYDGSGAEDR